MKKPLHLYRAAVVLASALIGVAGVATAANAGSGSNHGGGTSSGNHCTTADFDHTQFTFDNGAATIAVSLKRGTQCSSQDVTLVSYVAPQPKFATPQYLYDSRTLTISADRPTATFSVQVPDCNTQVDLFLGGQGDIISTLTDSGPRYGDQKLAYFNGGTSNCVQPAVQAITNCDGSVDLSLSNNGQLSRYEVDFVISYGSVHEKVTVSAGQATPEPVHVPAGSGTITVTADRLTPTTITWSRPATCLPAATAANDCKTVTVTVTNPKDNVAVKADVTYGKDTKSVTVAPGTSGDVTFPAGKATSATVAFPDLTDVTALTVKVVSGTCASPSSSAPTTSTSTSASPSASVSTSAVASPSAAPSTTPVSSNSNLPTTGGATAVVAGGALLLLIIGGALFFLARRRRVNFTA